MNETSRTAVANPGGREGQIAESNIVEDIAAFIRRFVFLRHDVLYDLLSAWVVATYLTNLFEYVGYIFAYSPEPQSGKSRLLEVLHCLVKNSSGLLVSPTEAVLFRTASNATLLLDEVDSWGNRDALKSVLNSGFQRNGGVVRMREGDGTYKTERHSAYGPKALAGIGTSILNVTTRDRTFMFEMVRQTRSEKREQWRTRKIEPNANSLKERIAKWSEVNKARVQNVYDGTESESVFQYVNDFRDRTVDISQPIAAIIEVAYADSIKLQAARLRLRQAISLTRHEEQSTTDQHKIIRQLLEISGYVEDPLVASPTELSEMFTRLLEDSTSPDTISATLRQYGFKTKSCRKGDGPGAPRYRYVLPKAKLVEILQRYAEEPEIREREPKAAEPTAAVAMATTEAAKDDVVSVVASLEKEEGQKNWKDTISVNLSVEPTTSTTQAMQSALDATARPLKSNEEKP